MLTYEATISRQIIWSAMAENDDQAREIISRELYSNGFIVARAAWGREGMPIRLAGKSTGTTTFINHQTRGNHWKHYSTF